LALEIATQLAAGLAAIHEQNLVHRDIKPTNIIVRLREGGSVTAKIIDLGLAKTVDEWASEAGISSLGVFAGTPEFASPEQFGGIGVGSWNQWAISKEIVQRILREYFLLFKTRAHEGCPHLKGTYFVPDETRRRACREALLLGAWFGRKEFANAISWQS